MSASGMPPGSGYENPIWYRTKWRIYKDRQGPYTWCFIHDDYDGAPDSHDWRYGFANSEEECREEIDRQIEDHEE